MTLTAHTAAGIFIGKYASNPFLAFLFGFLSHFLFDAIPHIDAGIFIEKYLYYAASVDIFLSAIFIFCFFRFTRPTHPLKIYWAILGSAMPDIFTFFYSELHFKFLKCFYDFHMIVHCPVKINNPVFWGAMQIIFLVCLIFILFKKKTSQKLVKL
ncbi:MAG: hypothetical protein WC697_00605 [Patescibacteria group bacterium]|jgi:hypothetical protein